MPLPQNFHRATLYKPLGFCLPVNQSAPRHQDWLPTVLYQKCILYIYPHLHFLLMAIRETADTRTH